MGDEPKAVTTMAFDAADIPQLLYCHVATWYLLFGDFFVSQLRIIRAFIGSAMK
jgi:hypothetical protein